MGIKFGDTPVATVATTDAAPAATPGGISLDLQKNVVLDLTKENPGLTLVTAAAGWDTALAGASGIDLDISALMLNENNKIVSADDVIYFRHKELPGIRLNKDNTTGEGEGDDETIDIDLSKIDPKYKAIVFIVNIYDAAAKRQTFGMVQNSYIRLLDKANGDKEICRYRLKDDYSTSTAVVCAKLLRDGGNWKFEAIGEGKVVKDLNDIVAMFM